MLITLTSGIKTFTLLLGFKSDLAITTATECSHSEGLNGVKRLATKGEKYYRLPRKRRNVTAD